MINIYLPVLTVGILSIFCFLHVWGKKKREFCFHWKICGSELRFVLASSQFKMVEWTYKWQKDEEKFGLNM